MTQAAYLIDASIPIFRYYFSMPDRWFSLEGNPTSAVYGYAHWLRNLLLKQQPKYIAACFDESLGTCFRNTIYEAYKQSRPPADEYLAFQFEACKEITRLMGVSVYASSTFEADDLIATIVSKNQRAGRQSIIVSRDKDLGQLLRGDDLLWNFPNDAPMGVKDIVLKFGVKPELIPDYLSLVGDPIDDVPGVPGVGRKTAAILLNYFDSVEDLFDRIDRLPVLGVRGVATLTNNLIEYKEQIEMAKKLVRLELRADLGGRLSLTRKKLQLEALNTRAKELGFMFKNSRF